MELQLGLALPTLVIATPKASSLLDLNSYSSPSDNNIEEQSDVSTEGCGSSISTHGSRDSSFNKKRSSDEAFEANDGSTNTFPQTLPLLLWSKHPKDEADHPKTSSLTLFRKEVEAEEIVGWPPIKTCRKKHCGGGREGLYVKAQMEGVVITRKIDLIPHQSYHSLVSTLLFMFGRAQESGDEYTLTYQDMEGDWLLASDVPWRIFVESVQRLKLLRNECLI